MRVLAVCFILMVMVAILAAQFGVAGYIAAGFKVLTLVFAAACVIGAARGGIRMSRPYKAPRAPMSRVRRSSVA